MPESPDTPVAEPTFRSRLIELRQEFGVQCGNCRFFRDMCGRRPDPEGGKCWLHLSWRNSTDWCESFALPEADDQ